VGQADGTAATLEVVVETRDAYAAEGALNFDGRMIVYCSLESGGGDLFIKDLLTGLVTPVVEADGYDGGPFFSPEGRRICYRSDRKNHQRNGDDLRGFMQMMLLFGGTATGWAEEIVSYPETAFIRL